MNKRMFLDNFDNKNGYLHFGTHVFFYRIKKINTYRSCYNTRIKK